jgi:hypothetical protein
LFLFSSELFPFEFVLAKLLYLVVQIVQEPEEDVEGQHSLLVEEVEEAAEEEAFC